MKTDDDMLFGMSDGSRFASRYPELAPLAPVSDAVRMLHDAGPPAERERKAEHFAEVITNLQEAEPDREREWVDFAGVLHRNWALQLRAAVQMLKLYGFEVDEETGEVTFPNGFPGPNPSLRSIAACMVLDGMNLEPTDEINNEVGEHVATRVSAALWYKDLEGTDESFKKTLRDHRDHRDDSTHCRLAVKLVLE